MMKCVKVLAATLVLSVSGAQAIDFKKPEDAVSHRQALMDLVRDNFSQLAPVIKDPKAYDAEKFVIYSGRLAALSSWIGDAFEKNINDVRHTGSEDRIWHKDSKFKQLVTEFAEHTAELSAVSGSGDMDRIQGALKQVASDCKSCHKPFRN